ncbi:MAG: GMC family oxidoreductase N-terminal domain-containing protein [Woeseiaceae bacterium]|nr:GMC family oxidoreductase N-terminal domain-containing protein [Woeseiaceae bacterium]
MSAYDYVVVGGGSAGSVLAGRLSENRNVSVCLIEAGPPDKDIRIRVPLGVVTLMGHPRYDWRYQSEPHAHLDGKRVSVPRGRTLGGSGSINSMVYIRGRPSDYDGWAVSGCAGWDWQSVLPRFIALENNSRLGGDPLHGSNGPLFVEDLPSPHPLIGRFVEAGGDAGIPANQDFNGAVQEGLGWYQTTMHRGRRWSPADAFLTPAKSRPNLTIVTDTTVDRIAFDGRRAASVECVGRDGPRSIAVREEVILAAGAIGSPSVLLRSGVGPAAHLASLSIPIVLDLAAVGGNLHDHPAIGMHYGGGDQGYALSFATLLTNAIAPFRYVFGRRGLFASNTVEGGGFAKTLPTLDEPDVQFHVIPARVGHEGSMLTWGRGYYSDVCLLKPRSRGRLGLHSADPETAPAIDLNLLADDIDREAFMRGVRLLRKLLEHPALKTGDAHELVPGPDVTTDEDLVAYVNDRLGTAYHPVGTCRMGAAGDPDAVVDPELKVSGLDNVRVADASVMPDIVAGNTNAPTMMIADKAAEMIRGTARAESAA